MRSTRRISLCLTLATALVLGAAGARAADQAPGAGPGPAQPFGRNDRAAEAAVRYLMGKAGAGQKLTLLLYPQGKDGAGGIDVVHLTGEGRTKYSYAPDGTLREVRQRDAKTKGWVKQPLPAMTGRGASAIAVAGRNLVVAAMPVVRAGASHIALRAIENGGMFNVAVETQSPKQPTVIRHSLFASSGQYVMTVKQDAKGEHFYTGKIARGGGSVTPPAAAPVKPAPMTPLETAVLQASSLRAGAHEFQGPAGQGRWRADVTHAGTQTLVRIGKTVFLVSRPNGKPAVKGLLNVHVVNGKDVYYGYRARRIDRTLFQEIGSMRRDAQRLHHEQANTPAGSALASLVTRLEKPESRQPRTPPPQQLQSANRPTPQSTLHTSAVPAVQAKPSPLRQFGTFLGSLVPQRVRTAWQNHFGRQGGSGAKGRP